MKATYLDQGNEGPVRTVSSDYNYQKTATNQNTTS